MKRIVPNRGRCDSYELCLPLKIFCFFLLYWVDLADPAKAACAFRMAAAETLLTTRSSF